MKSRILILSLALSALLPLGSFAQDDKAQQEQNKTQTDKNKLEAERQRIQAERRKLEGEQRKLEAEQRKLEGEQRKMMLEDSKAQEIVIRNKGDKNPHITVTVDGDNITVNGKPLADFKDDDISVSKRSIIIRGRGNFNNSTGLGSTSSDLFDSYSFFSDGKSRAFLGVSTEDDDAGAKITEITKESAAEKAGLKSGDIITKIDDKKVDGPESLMDVIGDKKPKDEVTVYYKRDGKDNQLKVALGERKTPSTMSYSFSTPDGYSRSYTIPRVNVSPDVKVWGDEDFSALAPLSGLNGMGNNNFNIMYMRPQRLGIRIQDTEDGKGVKILDVEKDSPADKAGLKKDDVVTDIAGKTVNNTDDARDQLQETREKAAYTIKAKRDGKEMNFDIKIPKQLKTANL